VLSDRRSFLAFSGSTAGTLLLAASANDVREALRYARAAAGMEPAPPWEFLTAEQAADVDAITTRIIPSDDGPGAREAGTVFFIDRALATWGSSRGPEFTRGLEGVNAEATKRVPAAARFAQLSPDRQVQLLRDLEKTPFFQQIRTATVWAFLCDPSRGGNQDKVGWRHIGFDDRFHWQPPFGDYDRDDAGGR